MSLSERLAQRRQGTVARASRGCVTCRWLATLTHDEKQAVESWLSDGDLSMTPLWEDCVSEGLTASLSAFREHVRRCGGAR
ncbi:Bacteriophage protein [Mycobacteroides abscessus subsp. massiliense]|nr:hypothetical protein BST32_01520 [Mycobacteroides abscessus subsp. massiliense]SLH43188.1 Bacteriophage protein [Mycobacteroides abscessus subsp. abscessus]SKD95995.1 Bacteriophage protein [Mycobacteroides abscessus subsp. massiliense]SKE08491.1 Bacteriophage protein [Mycobacteroides abscessus subsp. massiliense]SKE09504.1 Bacteriophage protein [Mycobacteroides abscessus subsp. massiliense]